MPHNIYSWSWASRIC